MTNDEIKMELAKFDWASVVRYGNTLGELNDRSLRFAKGTAVELAIEHFSQGKLVHVDQVHKDFDWVEKNLTVEVKSQLSASLFTRKNSLTTGKISVKLNNSNGTNKATSLDADHVCDIVIVVRKDSVFFIDKKTVLANSKSGGDGFVLTVSTDDIVPLTEKIKVDSSEDYSSTIRESIKNAYKKDIENFVGNSLRKLPQ